LSIYGQSRASYAAPCCTNVWLERIRRLDNRPSILIVDDEPSNRNLARGIASAAGWRPDEAESGEAAVNAARAQAFTLILMDVQMPGIDGFAATRAIRAGDGPNASTPILAFTAVPPGDAIERGRAAGMDGHIAKPFTPETLLAAIDPWRPHGGPSPAAPLIAIFGEAEIAGLLARFRSQLVDALAADEPAAERRARAQDRRDQRHARLRRGFAGLAGRFRGGRIGLGRCPNRRASGDPADRHAGRLSSTPV
jgi:CheY-like chemotaxis protein